MNIIERAQFILKTEDCIYSPKEYREVIAGLLKHIEEVIEMSEINPPFFKSDRY